MDITLYYAPGACSLATHVTLEEAAAPYNTVRVMLAEGQQRSAKYLSINPMGRVPALVTPDGILTETIGALSYVSNRFPSAELLPFGDSWGMGKAYDRMSWLAAVAHVAIAQIWRTERFTTDAAAQESVREHGRVQIGQYFERIESGLSGEWMLGDRYSVLDPYLMVFWRWGLRLQMDMASYARWADHTARVMSRPAVERVIAREQSATDNCL